MKLYASVMALARILSACVVILFGAICRAQWIVANLHPAGATESALYGIDATHQAGMFKMGGNSLAAVWSSSPLGTIDVHPATFDESVAYGIDGDSLAGAVYSSRLSHAAYWGSFAPVCETLTNLARQSVAYAASGGWQVGSEKIGSTTYARLWHGTAASAINLTSGTLPGEALGIDSSFQVGYVVPDPVARQDHACIWHGTSTYIDLNPAGAFRSRANAASGGVTVGEANFDAGPHAGYWTPFELVWHDLHPVAATSSSAKAVCGPVQVGFALIGGKHHASLWRGSALTWVDLHKYLPTNYSDSYATAVFDDFNQTRVAGYAFNTTLNRNEAVMWVWVGPWKPVLLDTSSTTGRALGIDHEAVVGYEFELTQPHAMLWNALTGTAIDLHPSGFATSQAESVLYVSPGVSKQVGTALYANSNPAAMLWNGTSSGVINLNPPGHDYSYGHAISINSQGGSAQSGDSAAASMWGGTATSHGFIDGGLGIYSEVLGIWANQQVGYRIYSSGEGYASHATLWRGSYASLVDLSPPGSLSSKAYGVWNGRVVGNALFGGAYKAVMWTGGAASWQDLTPAGASPATAYAVSQNYQVGQATFGGKAHALIWRGDNTTWTDLHAFLPSGFDQSYATGVSEDESRVYVCGYALPGPQPFVLVSPKPSWSVVNLEPESASESHAYAVSGSLQGGDAKIGGTVKATVWSGTASFFTNLDPPGAFSSSILGMSDNFQAGVVSFDGVSSRARYWSLTRPGFNLHSGTGSSAAYACTDSVQGGSLAPSGGDPSATLWGGSPVPYTNLHPGGVTSTVYGMDSNQQVGSAFQVAGASLRQHAFMWTGSSASAVDLTPTFATGAVARGVSGGVQGGEVQLPFGNTSVSHACIWQGSAGSFVDIHPVGATSSSVNGMYSSIKVGEATINGQSHASIWNGISNSWEDLHQALPDGFRYSVATAVSIYQGKVRVVGYGYNSMVGHEQALLWICDRPTVSGKIIFNDAVGPPAVVQIDFKDQDHQIVETQTAKLDSDGSFVILAPDLPAGRYFVSTAPSPYLRSSTGPVDTNTSVTGLTLNLVPGDIDSDNEITLIDYALFVLAFDSIEGSPNWNPAADLDRDGEVTLYDYSILSRNFGLVGDD